jgi:hypothetical protein
MTLYSLKCVFDLIWEHTPDPHGKDSRRYLCKKRLYFYFNLVMQFYTK